MDADVRRSDKDSGAGGRLGRPDRRVKRSGPQERRPRRMSALFKALVLLALIAATAYGVLRSGIYFENLWLPVAAGILGLLFITFFVGSYYRDVPRVGWILVVLLAILVGTKGLSLAWTISETETIRELLRSSMYLATFVLVLAAVSSGRQISPLIDAVVLIVAAVAGYGLLQKIDPLTYPTTSLDAARIGSTLGVSEHHGDVGRYRPGPGARPDDRDAAGAAPRSLFHSGVGVWRRPLLHLLPGRHTWRSGSD